MYHGPREQVVDFFQGLGFQLPSRKGVADFLQEITSRKEQKVCHPPPPFPPGRKSALHACCAPPRMQVVLLTSVLNHEQHCDDQCWRLDEQCYCGCLAPDARRLWRRPRSNTGRRSGRGASCRRWRWRRLSTRRSWGGGAPPTWRARLRSLIAVRRGPGPVAGEAAAACRALWQTNG